MTSGLSLIVVAVAAITVSRSFDGFVQGLLGGAGFALVVIGVVTLSPLLRRSPRPDRAGEVTGGAEGGGHRTDRAQGPEEGWLPSRDNRP